IPFRNGNSYGPAKVCLGVEAERHANAVEAAGHFGWVFFRGLHSRKSTSPYATGLLTICRLDDPDIVYKLVAKLN
ncbi:hypothetical protein DF186_20855, partial [Enterococcus hirae]